MQANLNEFLIESRKNLGASYNLVTGEINPKEGYMVSLSDHEEAHENLSEDIVRQYVMKHAEVLYDDENLYIGSWFDEDEAMWYLDISENKLDLETAIYLGILRQQKAIYDIKRGESIGMPKPMPTMDKILARLTANGISMAYLTEKALGIS